jgi:hypothetical protein
MSEAADLQGGAPDADVSTTPSPGSPSAAGGHAAAAAAAVGSEAAVAPADDVGGGIDPPGCDERGRAFERACRECCGCTGAAVRARALELCPPRDDAALARAAAATAGAVADCMQAGGGGLDIYSLALGHELAVGSFSRVRYAKMIVKGMEQSLWPEVAVKVIYDENQR